MKNIRKKDLKKKHVKSRYHKLLENMPEGYQVIDRSWRYVYVNSAVAVHAGKQKRELLGRSLMDVYPGIENSEFFSILKRCMRKQTSCEMESEFTYPDGSSAWFSLFIYPVPDGVSVLSIDITARKIAEKEIQKLNAVLEKCVAVRKVRLPKQPAKNSLLSIIGNNSASGRRIAR